MHFWTFRLQPPHAPLFRPCLLLRTGLTPASRGCAIGGSSDFALCSQSRQSHKAVSSSFRGFTINPSVLRTIHSLPVALHPASPRRSYFPLLAFSSAREGLPPSYAHSISSARARSSRPHPSASRRRNPFRGSIRAPACRGRRLRRPLLLPLPGATVSVAPVGVPPTERGVCDIFTR